MEAANNEDLKWWGMHLDDNDNLNINAINKAIGWAWVSETFTYDFIKEVHPLPTENSFYFGGTYIKKDLNLPPNAGIQLYYQVASYFFTKKEWLYGYMDRWNKAPILICHRLGGERYNFIEDYGREY